ncbi:MAG: phytanoyl-CoA dioxygenase family protein [Burkholderiaceae bacterium]
MSEVTVAAQDGSRVCLDLEHDGFAVMRGVISPAQVRELEQACDRVCQAHANPAKPRSKVEVAGPEALQFDVVRKLACSDRLLHPILQSLGPNIYVNYAGFTMNPPQAAGKEPMAFHQDGGRISQEQNDAPDPRYSIKVAIWITDGMSLGRGNFHVIPGSHTWRERPALDLDTVAVPVHVAEGDAIFFERRVWHTRKPNLSNVTRKVLFFDFAPRWMEPKYPANAALEYDSPLESQLFGNEQGWTAFAPKKRQLPTLGVIQRLAIQWPRGVSR